ncbi:tetratricopeptide repeat protein, partial [Kaarinaea lacus]
QNNAAGAYELLTNLQKQLPDSPEPLNELGNLYALDGKEARAREYFQKSLEKKADYVPALINLARMELLSGKTEAAKSMYEKILSDHPGQKDALISLAEINVRTGNKKQALEYLEKARTLYPQSLTPRVVLAQLYMQDRNMIKAEEVLNEAVRLNPADLKVLEAQGMFLLASGDSKKALDIFSKLVTKSPSAAHYYQLAQAQRVTKKYPDAESSLEKALKIDSAHMPSLILKAHIDLAMGKKSEAMKSYEKIIEQQPNNVFALNNLAMLSLETDKSKALDLARRAYAINKSAPYADTLGWVLLKNGSVEQALVHFNEAHKAMPENASISYHLAIALVETGDKAAAKKILNKIVDSGEPFHELDDAKQLLAKLD